MPGSFSFSFGLGEIFNPDEPMSQEDVESLLAVRDREVEDYLSYGTRRGDFKLDAINTGQTTTSTSYTDLATAGPTITCTTGTSALVTLGAYVQTPSTEAVYMSFAVSGPSSIGASDTRSFTMYNGAGTLSVQASSIVYLTTLTSGTNTFTAKYRTTGGTATFATRVMLVQAL